MKHASCVPYGKQIPLHHHDLTQKLGPIYRINFYGVKQIMLSDPEHMETVLRSEGPNEAYPDAEYPKVPMLTGLYGTYKKMSTDLYPTNRGIIGIDGEEWWKARYLRNIHFHFKTIQYSSTLSYRLEEPIGTS